MQGQELDLIVLAGHFQLHMFYDSVKNGFPVERFLLSAALFDICEISGSNVFSFWHLNVEFMSKFTTCI